MRGSGLVMNKEVRKVFRLEDGGVFKEVNFKDLKKDDMFKMYEPDGMLVSDKNDRVLFTCISDAYINDGVYTVDINGS
jgi:hypothetical protein